jgi:ATP-dependent 26S proteasome regulatory subunit
MSSVSTPTASRESQPDVPAAIPRTQSRHDKFVKELKDLIKARFPIIQIATYEEERVLVEIEKIAKALDHRLLVWSASRGVYKLSDAGQDKDNKFAHADLAVALEFITVAAEKQKGPLLLVLLDPDPYLTDKNANPTYRRKLRDVAISIRSQGYMANCLIVSPGVNIPVELEKEVTVLDFPLPDRDEIRDLVQRVMQRLGETNVVRIGKDGALTEALVDAALGLTLAEIESCLARSIVEDKKLDIDDVRNITRQKQLIIRKNGLLEFYDTKELGVDQIGGLDVLKDWLKTRELAFSRAGQEYGIATPKGVLLTGVPGCGKSLAAKCVAASWHLPLIRLDVGKIYSRWIGSSEENVRSAIATTESVAPCVLWIDEIEKAMPRLEGHVGDSGVSMRVFASFLTWLQEKTAPVFVFATANQINMLPPEALRKGRFDEIFFVDLPLDSERREIIDIHIRKINRVPRDFDIEELVRLSGEESLGDGIRFSGAEIESWVNEALIHSFYRAQQTNEGPRLLMEDFRAVVGRISPLAKMRREEIGYMRQWANDHAISASRTPSHAHVAATTAKLPGGRRVTISE